jgi:hypothetical protein
MPTVFTVPPLHSHNPTVLAFPPLCNYSTKFAWLHSHYVHHVYSPFTISILVCVYPACTISSLYSLYSTQDTVFSHAFTLLLLCSYHIPTVPTWPPSTHCMQHWTLYGQSPICIHFSPLYSRHPHCVCHVPAVVTLPPLHSPRPHCLWLFTIFPCIHHITTYFTLSPLYSSVTIPGTCSPLCCLWPHFIHCIPVLSIPLGFPSPSVCVHRVHTASPVFPLYMYSSCRAFPCWLDPYCFPLWCLLVSLCSFPLAIIPLLPYILLLP